MFWEPMTTSDKLAHLLHHWIEHNDDHAGTYREWAERAEAEGLPAAGALREAIEAVGAASDALRRAAEALGGRTTGHGE